MYKVVLVIMMGMVNMSNVTRIDEVNRLITFIWSCTNFLVPKTNG